MTRGRRIIYIRHGEDTRSGYKYDEKLTKKGKKGARRLSRKLIDKYGVPDAIYYSPFHRTRQTKRIMVKEIKKITDRWVEVLECDPRLSRYFTRKQKEDPDIRNDTMRRDPPIYETWDEFHHRIKEQFKELVASDYKIIWCITHTLVLDYIVKYRNLAHEYRIPYFDTLVLSRV